MAGPQQPLLTFIRHTTTSLPRRTSSLPRSSLQTHHPQCLSRRALSCTPHRTLRQRSRPENKKSMKALAAEADENFSMSQSSYELNTTRGMQDSVPREYSVVEPESMFGPPAYGFFADSERGIDHDGDPEFDMDDISASAHGELEQVRELRELERVSGWDAPRLWEQRKEFKKPEDGMLRWRYTTYLGETHAGSRKVVLEFSPYKLPNLSQQQADKLVKLLGVRYDPHSKRAKMSSENYPTAPQNKNHLVGLLEKLLRELREGQDTFADVPFDFRHAKQKPKLTFPREWKLDEERKRYLAGKWAEARKGDETREVEGQVADGKKLMGVPLEALGEEPEMVVAERRKK